MVTPGKDKDRISSGSGSSSGSSSSSRMLSRRGNPCCCDCTFKCFLAAFGVLLVLYYVFDRAPVISSPSSANKGHNKAVAAAFKQPGLRSKVSQAKKTSYSKKPVASKKDRDKERGLPIVKSLAGRKDMIDHDRLKSKDLGLPKKDYVLQIKKPPQLNGKRGPSNHSSTPGKHGNMAERVKDEIRMRNEELDDEMDDTGDNKDNNNALQEGRKGYLKKGKKFSQSAELRGKGKKLHLNKDKKMERNSKKNYGKASQVFTFEPKYVKHQNKNVVLNREETFEESRPLGKGKKKKSNLASTDLNLQQADRKIGENGKMIYQSNVGHPGREEVKKKKADMKKGRFGNFQGLKEVVKKKVNKVRVQSEYGKKKDSPGKVEQQGAVQETENKNRENKNRIKEKQKEEQREKDDEGEDDQREVVKKKLTPEKIAHQNVQVGMVEPKGMRKEMPEEAPYRDSQIDLPARRGNFNMRALKSLSLTGAIAGRNKDGEGGKMASTHKQSTEKSEGKEGEKLVRPKITTSQAFKLRRPKVMHKLLKKKSPSSKMLQKSKKKSEKFLKKTNRKGKQVHKGTLESRQEIFYLERLRRLKFHISQLRLTCGELCNTGAGQKVLPSQIAAGQKVPQSQIAVGQKVAQIQIAAGQKVPQSPIGAGQKVPQNPGSPSALTSTVKKHLNCPVLLSHPQSLPAPMFENRWKTPPEFLHKDFSYQNRLKIVPSGSEESSKNATIIKSNQMKLLDQFNEWIETKVSVKNKRVLVVGGAVGGAASPWLESLALAHGARQVVTINLGGKKSKAEHEKITSLSLAALTRRFLRGEIAPFDVLLSFGALEHLGLGSARDPEGVNPWADLMLMAKIWCMTNDKGGKALVAIPMAAKDALVWNSHRCYGPLTFAQLTANWIVKSASKAAPFQRLYPQDVCKKSEQTLILLEKKSNNF